MGAVQLHAVDALLSILAGYERAVQEDKPVRLSTVRPPGFG